MSDAQRNSVRIYEYKMSWRLIALGTAFSFLLVLFFGHRVMFGSHSLLLFRAIDLGPELSKAVYFVFMATGFFLGYVYWMNAIWTATGGRKVVVCLDSVGVPGWLRREPKLVPLRDVHDLRLKNQGGRLMCDGINLTGKKVFRADSWQFRSMEDFADFVANVQLRAELAESR